MDLKVLFQTIALLFDVYLFLKLPKSAVGGPCVPVLEPLNNYTSPLVYTN